jgi:hypothetical protein
MVMALIIVQLHAVKQSDEVVQPTQKRVTPVKKNTQVASKKTSQTTAVANSTKKNQMAVAPKKTTQAMASAEKVVSKTSDQSAIASKQVEVTKSTVFGDVPADAYNVDRVVVKIYSGEDAVIILASDIKPALDGMPRTVDDIIFERLAYLDAKKYKMGADEEEIDKDIANIQKQHNITLDQLKQVLKTSGYTYEEGRSELASMRVIGQLLDFKIKGKLVVADKDIEAYFDEHPEMEEASYHVAKTFVPYSTTKLSADFFDELEAMVKNKNKMANIEWQEPFWIDHSALAKDKMFITQMEAGEMAGPYDVGDGYEIYELVAKKEERLKPLKERYAQIANMLRKPKYDELLAEYKTNLLASATIKHF